MDRRRGQISRFAARASTSSAPLLRTTLPVAKIGNAFRQGSRPMVHRPQSTAELLARADQIREGIATEITRTVQLHAASLTLLYCIHQNITAIDEMERRSHEAIGKSSARLGKR
jgi:hypothetical protein